MLRVEGHHLGDKFLGGGGDGSFFAVFYLSVGDQPVELLLVTCSEGENTDQH